MGTPSETTFVCGQTAVVVEEKKKTAIFYAEVLVESHPYDDVCGFHAHGMGTCDINGLLVEVEGRRRRSY